MEKQMKSAEDVKVTVIQKEKESDQIINEHVGFSLLAGAIPVPLLDIAAVTAIQVDMLRQLAKKYEIDFQDEAGKSIVTSIIGTTFGTSIGRAGASVVKAIPGIGTILGITTQAALSGVTTFAIGHVFHNHFRNHKPLNEFRFEDIRQTYEDLLKKGKEFVDGFQKKKDSEKQDMKEQTAVVLRNMAEKGVIKKSDAEKIIKAMGGKEPSA